MDKIGFNKKRQELRRIHQLKRYGKKIEAFTSITEKEVLAYAAGIIDGEGCIHIVRGRAKGARLTHQYNLVVRVGMSVPMAIQWLYKHFGGAIKVRDNKGWKPIHTWAISAIEAEGFLRCILPYLKVKLKEAELGLEFREHLNNYIRAQGRIIDIKEVATREAYKLKMQELKR